MNKRYIWLNGAVVPLQEAVINVLSPTAQFGLNVFEGIRCYWNSRRAALMAFKLEEHFDRLERSLKMLRLRCPYPREEWARALAEVVRANNYREDIAIRQTVFVGGDSGSWFSTEPTGMFIAPVPRPRKASPLTDGISCCVSSWERISERSFSPKIKAGANYINSRMAQLEAVTNGYDSALFLNHQGSVAEGPGSCFFMVRGGALITPPLSASVLESITRDVLLRLASTRLNLPVEERPVDRTELYVCDEAFLCGSAVELTPVLSVDGYAVGAGSPGPVTVRLHEVYLQAVEGELSGCEGWATQIV